MSSGIHPTKNLNILNVQVSLTYFFGFNLPEAFLANILQWGSYCTKRDKWHISTDYSYKLQYTTKIEI